jgi:hypothetical protein
VGQRANLVIIERGTRSLYYDHWCANRLDIDLFWGPRLALEFVRQREPVEESDGWLDTTWCEGAAVVDVDRSTLLWFGGEDILRDVPLRRAHLQLMRELWRGWEIEWAYEGILSIADRLQLSRARFIGGPEDDTPGMPTFNEDYPDDNSVLTSLRREDGELVVGRLCFDADSLRVGPRLIELIAAHSKAHALVWNRDFPDGGIHIDCPLRTLDMWWASTTPDVLARVRAAWPGWTVRWHQDHYERHLELADGKLLVPEAADQRARALALVEANLEHEARNPARDLLPRLGANVQINSATDHVRGSVGVAAEKRSLLASLSR